MEDSNGPLNQLMNAKKPPIMVYHSHKEHKKADLTWITNLPILSKVQLVHSLHTTHIT